MIYINTNKLKNLQSPSTSKVPGNNFFFPTDS